MANENCDSMEDDPRICQYFIYSQIRTAIVTVLTEIPVNDIESVSSTISILNEATEVTGEVSQEAQVSVKRLGHFLMIF